MTKENLCKTIHFWEINYLECIPHLTIDLLKENSYAIEELSSVINDPELMQYHIERKKIIEKYNYEKESGFNLYDDLSINDKFYEIEHSKIIKKILDKNNKVIGDCKHLLVLRNLIKEKGILIDDFDSDYIVEKEMKYEGDLSLGSIDIFIYEKREGGKCIIIENKITGAKDQDNQLARYYEIAEKLNKEVAVIIYLPFYYKYPPFHSYFGKYKKYIEEIEKNKLCIIPAINVGNIDFTHGFLDKCVSLANEKNKHTISVCIEQYSKFLKSKGEEKEMAKNIDRKFLEKLLSDEPTMEVVVDIVDIWNRKNETIDEILKEKLSKHSFHDWKNLFIRELDLYKDIFIFWYLNGDKFEIGFHHEKGKFSSVMIANLKNILLENDHRDIISDVTGDKEWIYGVYNEKKLLGTYEQMFNQLLKVLEDLREKAGKVLSSTN